MFGTAPCSTGGTTYGGTLHLVAPCRGDRATPGLDAAQADAVRAGAVITCALSPATASGDQVRRGGAPSSSTPTPPGPPTHRSRCSRGQPSRNPTGRVSADRGQDARCQPHAGIGLVDHRVALSARELHGAGRGRCARCTPEAVERLEGGTRRRVRGLRGTGFTRDDRIVSLPCWGLRPAHSRHHAHLDSSHRRRAAK